MFVPHHICSGFTACFYCPQVAKDLFWTLILYYSVYLFQQVLWSQHQKRSSTSSQWRSLIHSTCSTCCPETAAERCDCPSCLKCLSLSLRSVTACWSCSWATLEPAFTVLVSSESEDCWWPSAPWCWPYLTSYRSPMNLTLSCTVRGKHRDSWYDSVQSRRLMNHIHIQFMRLYVPPDTSPPH